MLASSAPAGVAYLALSALRDRPGVRGVRLVPGAPSSMVGVVRDSGTRWFSGKDLVAALARAVDALAPRAVVEEEP